MMGDELTYRIAISNSKSDEMRLTLEPWGDELIMPVGAVWQFVTEKNRFNESIEIQFYDDGVAVFGIRDSFARVLHGDELLWECWQTVSPPPAE